MQFYYKLDENKNPVPCDMFQCDDLLGSKDKIVCQEYIGDYFVSTVFLAIDHNFRLNDKKGKPVLFETMVKSPKEGWLNYQERYCTWKEAEEGHQRAVAWVKGGCQWKEDEGNE